MISFRCLFVLLPLLALAACDNEPAPPIEPVEPPKPRVSAPAVPLAQAPVVAPAAKPSAKQASEPAKASPTPRPVANTPPVKDKPEVSVAKTPIAEPRLELDLSLPEELLESMESVEPFSELPSPLLPPLFDEQSAASSPFQLQGKLITNERGDQDYWESLEGAELQFEFKR